MLIIKAIFAMGVLAIMLWGAAESYTRNKYGEFSPKHVAVLNLIPGRLIGSAPKVDNPRETKRQPARQ